MVGHWTLFEEHVRIRLFTAQFFLNQKKPPPNRLFSNISPCPHNERHASKISFLPPKKALGHTIYKSGTKQIAIFAFHHFHNTSGYGSIASIRPVIGRQQFLDFRRLF